MAFTVEDFHDLLRLLEQHPQWRADLRRHLLPDDLLELPAIVRQLAEAQARLAEAQARTEQQLASLTARVDALAEAQARTEARVTRVEQRLAELAEAQARTERNLAALSERLDRFVESAELRFSSLELGLQRVQQHVGSLSELVGAAAEVEAQRVLERLLRERGYRILARPGPIAVDGEVDVAAPVADPSGKQLWVLVEVKARLHRGDVQSWDRRLRDAAFLARLQAEGVSPPLLAYAFGLRVYRDAEAEGKNSGIGILDPAGELVEALPRSA